MPAIDRSEISVNDDVCEWRKRRVLLKKKFDRDLVLCAAGRGHPNLRRVFGLSTAGLVVEPLTLTLETWMGAHRPTLDDVVRMCRDVASGMAHIHERKIKHGMLGLETVLLTQRCAKVSCELKGDKDDVVSFGAILRALTDEFEELADRCSRGDCTFAELLKNSPLAMRHCVEYEQASKLCITLSNLRGRSATVDLKLLVTGAGGWYCEGRTTGIFWRLPNFVTMLHNLARCIAGFRGACFRACWACVVVRVGTVDLKLVWICYESQTMATEILKMLRKFGADDLEAVFFADDHPRQRIIAPLTPRSLLVLKSGYRFVTAGADGALRLHDESGVRFLGGYGCHIFELVVHKHLAITASADGFIKVWDLHVAACVLCIEAHSAAVTALAVLENNCVATGSRDRSIKLWDLKTGASTLVGKHRDWVRCLAWAKCGLVSASNEHDFALRVWDLATPNAQNPTLLKGHVGSPTCLLVHDNEILSGGHDAQIRHWRDAHCVATFGGHRSPVEALARLDQRLVSGGRDREVRVWHLDTGVCSYVLESHKAPVTALVLVDHDVLVSGAQDRTLCLWNLAAPHCDATIIDTSPVTAISRV